MFTLAPPSPAAVVQWANTPQRGEAFFPPQTKNQSLLDVNAVKYSETPVSVCVSPACFVPHFHLNLHTGENLSPVLKQYTFTAAAGKFKTKASHKT